MESNSQTKHLSTKTLEKIEKKVNQYRPEIKKIKETYGSLSYFQYAKQKNRINLNKTFRERKNEVVETIVAETSRLIGSAIAESLQNQLKKNDSMSTAEHTAPLGTTNMLNTSLHMAVPMFENEDPKMKNILSLSCSGVSFNNFLSFSRGHQFHTHTEESQITFFGRSVDSATVLYAPPYKITAIQEITKRLSLFLKDGQLTQTEIEKIQMLLDTIYSAPHALTGTDYVDQLAVTNFYLWKNLFPAYKEKAVPNYIMLSQEKIILQLLLQYHLDHDTIITKLLFNSTFHESIEKHFVGINGAFTKDHSSGTFLFWGIAPKDHVRIQLFRKGNRLISNDESFSIELTPQAIREAIMKKEIFPSLMLTFTILSFYYGLRLGGGASQTSYLREMKNAYIAMLRELGESDAAQDAQDSVTDDFVFYRPHLAFLEHNGKKVSATGMDMYLYQDPTKWAEIIQATKDIPLEDFMTTLLPVLYKQFCPDDEKEDALMNVTREDIEKFIGLDKKLPSLGIIS